MCVCLDICKFRLLNLEPSFSHWLRTRIFLCYIFISVISCLTFCCSLSGPVHCYVHKKFSLWMCWCVCVCVFVYVSFCQAIFNRFCAFDTLLPAMFRISNNHIHKCFVTLQAVLFYFPSLFFSSRTKTAKQTIVYWATVVYEAKQQFDPIHMSSSKWNFIQNMYRSGVLRLLHAQCSYVFRRWTHSHIHPRALTAHTHTWRHRPFHKMQRNESIAKFATLHFQLSAINFTLGFSCFVRFASPRLFHLHHHSFELAKGRKLLKTLW